METLKLKRLDKMVLDFITQMVFCRAADQMSAKPQFPHIQLIERQNRELRAHWNSFK
jgi:hypothetical protein